MKDKHWIALVILIIIVSVVAFNSRECKTDDINKSKVVFDVGGEPVLEVVIDDTPAERAKGLMNVSYMAEDEGMVFIFQKPTNTFFWMKNTLIPLDMFFIKNDTVMYIAHAVPCEVDQCPTYGPGQYYDYVIETNAGYADNHSIVIGTAVELD